MKLMEKENGWYRIGDAGFAKKIGDNLFKVIRIESNEAIHLDFYDKIDISSVKAEDIGEYGNYDEYLNLKTDFEKAIYLAFVTYTHDGTSTWKNVKEVKSVLVKEQVIKDTEDFSLLTV